jgi:uncharacterized peroxidase-related enzyme
MVLPAACCAMVLPAACCAMVLPAACCATGVTSSWGYSKSSLGLLPLKGIHLIMSTAAMFPAHTAASAPPDARPIIESTAKEFGFVPAPVARMATSPEALQGFMKLNELFQESSLDELAREVLIFTLATRNACRYCVGMHTAVLTKSGADADLIDALRRGAPLADLRLEAVRVFTIAVLDGTGKVSDEALAAFVAAGFTARSALDVVLGIGTYTISTFVNRMTGAPLDAPFEAFAWDSAVD